MIQYEDEREGFFSWLFSNRMYWIVSIIYAGSASLEDLRLGLYGEVFAIFIASLIVVSPFFLIFYLFESSVIKKVNRQLKWVEKK